MPWQGYNFEDAILISERLVYDDIFTSIHIERYKIEIDRNSELSEQTTKNIPNLSLIEIKHLNENGIITVGTFVKPGDILVGKVISNNTSDQFLNLNYYVLFLEQKQKEFAIILIECQMVNMEELLKL
jgi:DNA-directed RNA polymerase subunit beta